MDEPLRSEIREEIAQVLFSQHEPAVMNYWTASEWQRDHYRTDAEPIMDVLDNYL